VPFCAGGGDITIAVVVWVLNILPDKPIGPCVPVGPVLPVGPSIPSRLTLYTWLDVPNDPRILVTPVIVIMPVFLL
jgi:hypothetical protein